uniref:Uncharacterized protein n=1 Tax=Glossina pallidipes TaxID=7398 RepID=A0A1B0GGP5_GLOPL
MTTEQNGELPPVPRCVKIVSASSFYLWRFIAKRRSRSLLVRFGDDGVQRQTAPVPQFAPHISFMKLWSRFCNNVFLNIVTASKCSSENDFALFRLTFHSCLLVVTYSFNVDRTVALLDLR